MRASGARWNTLMDTFTAGIMAVSRIKCHQLKCMPMRPRPLGPVSSRSPSHSPVASYHGFASDERRLSAGWRRGVNAVAAPAAEGITASVIQKLQGDEEVGI